MIFLPVMVLPAHRPVSPDPGVLGGRTSSASTDHAVPFSGWRVKVILTGCELQLRSQRLE